MTKFRLILTISTICLLMSSCFSEDKFDNSRKGNFNALWQILDERYCFFEYKDVDWDEVYTRYSSRIEEQMSREALFGVMKEMLDELKDGHVNLVTPFDQSRYWKWFEDYPKNFDVDIIENDNYLGTDYKIASGLKYKVLMDNVGYVYYSSFSSGVGEGNLHEVIANMLSCDGIIIDIRNNGGGQLSNGETFISGFIREELSVGYMMHKTGKGHNDFSKPFELKVKPYTGYSYQKRVVVLTNRKCYSAANDFVSAMKSVPTVTIMGDKTGGGGGMPFSSELPNGWGVRFSASPRLDAQMEQIEFGVEPDIEVQMTDEDKQKGLDTIIEAAREYLKNPQN